MEVFLNANIHHQSSTLRCTFSNQLNTINYTMMFSKWKGILKDLRFKCQFERNRATYFYERICLFFHSKLQLLVGLGRLVAGILGSNPAQGMDVCPRLSVLCCPV
jgi:hypothetical protein